MTAMTALSVIAAVLLVPNAVYSVWRAINARGTARMAGPATAHAMTGPTACSTHGREDPPSIAHPQTPREQ